MTRPPAGDDVADADAAGAAAVPGGGRRGSRTTGVPALDELIDDVRVGENLVFIADDTAALDIIGRSFLEAADPQRTALVAVGTGAAALAAPPGTLILDHRSAHGSVAELHEDVASADARLGRDATFVIASLTDVQQRWGDEAALQLFLTVCPRLYRRGSVALWLLDATGLDTEFLERLCEITQVVVRLTGDGPHVQAEAVVAAGRPATARGRRVTLEIVDGTLVPVGQIRRGHDRLGELIRSQRLLRGLSQSELAKRIGISPSAISQVERGVRGIGGETLMRIWEVLGVPFGPDDTLQRGYRVGRRSAHRRTELADGATGHLLVDDVSIGECWRITLEPGSSGANPLFDGRIRESLLMERGVLELKIGGHREVLQEGDSLVVPRASIDAWRNPGPTEATVTWWVLA